LLGVSVRFDYYEVCRTETFAIGLSVVAEPMIPKKTAS